MKRIDVIRKARTDELPRLLEIYQIARAYMRNTGNPDQWGDDYPPIDALKSDIEDGVIYVLERDSDNSDKIYAVFLLMNYPEPTYDYIDGAWMDSSEYVTIHKVASDGTEKNVFSSIVEFAKQRCNHIRIDTHKQNLTMQHVIEKNGFEYCGIIYLQNGDARMAYEWIRK